MRRLLIMLLLAVLLGACAKPLKQAWTELPTPGQLRQQVAEIAGRFTALDAAAKVSLTVQGKYLSTQQFLLLEKPDRLRFDVLTGFGQLLLQLSSDGEELAVFTRTTVPGRFYRGPASSENLARFTRIPLSTPDMVRILLYDPPVIDSTSEEVFLDGDMLVLSLENSLFRQELLFDQQLQFRGCRYYRDEQVFLSVLYQQLDEQLLFPRKIRIAMPEQQLEAAIKFSQLALNVAIPGERFSLQKPDELVVEPLL